LVNQWKAVKLENSDDAWAITIAYRMTFNFDKTAIRTILENSEQSESKHIRMASIRKLPPSHNILVIWLEDAPSFIVFVKEDNDTTRSFYHGMNYGNILP